MHEVGVRLDDPGEPFRDSMNCSSRIAEKQACILQPSLGEYAQEMLCWPCVSITGNFGEVHLSHKCYISL